MQQVQITHIAFIYTSGQICFVAICHSSADNNYQGTGGYYFILFSSVKALVGTFKFQIFLQILFNEILLTHLVSVSKVVLNNPEHGLVRNY